MAYRSAASCEPTKDKPDREPLESALARAETLMVRILDGTTRSGDNEGYKVFLGGSENFRYAIDPEYKANRKNTVRPLWLEPVREMLITSWGATICDGIEADDALGIASDAFDTIIASVDKDLLQIPGYHYNIVSAETLYMDEHTARVNLYTQLIMGDRSDNIKGYDGKMRQKVPQFLQPYIDQLRQCSTEKEMFTVVYDMYELGDVELLKNGQLLYIQRKEDDTWQFPI